MPSTPAELPLASNFTATLMLSSEIIFSTFNSDLTTSPSTYVFRLFSSNPAVDNILAPWAGCGEACVHA